MAGDRLGETNSRAIRCVTVNALVLAASLLLGGCWSDGPGPADRADDANSIPLPEAPHAGQPSRTGKGGNREDRPGVTQPDGDPTPPVIFQDIADDCRAFRYERALAACDRLEAQAAKPQAVANGHPIEVALYIEMVRREAAHFRLVDRRLRTGERSGFINFAWSPRARLILGVSEEGIHLKDDPDDSDAGPLFPWSGLPDYQECKLMFEVGTTLTTLSEQLAIAIFAQHRGLTHERDARLKTAMALSLSSNSKEQQEAFERIARVIEHVPVGKPQEAAAGSGNESSSSEAAENPDREPAPVF